MPPSATCPHCQHTFAAAAELAGGITNCPHCGKAVEVPGLNDPMWRLLQFGVVLGAAAGGWIVGLTSGPLLGVTAGAAMLGGAWLVSRVL